MNVKKFIIASIAVFVTLQVLDFVVHYLILGSTYQSERLMTIWRPDMMSLMWLMYVAGAILAVVFVYIFAKGYSGKGIMEGARYGLIIGILMSLLGSLYQYVIYPVPLDLTVKWIVFGLIEFIIAGIVVALIYKPKVSVEKE